MKDPIRQHFIPEYKGGGVKKTYPTRISAEKSADEIRKAGRPLIEVYEMRLLRTLSSRQ